MPDSPAHPPSLNATTTGALLPFDRLVDALERAVHELADGFIACPVRQVVPLPSGGRLLSMTAVAPDLAVHKLVTVVGGNPRHGLPTIQGRLTLLDQATGTVTMTLDAATVTGRRTAAVTLLGFRALLPHAPRAILLIGNGVQAAHHVDAFAAIVPAATVYVLGRDERAARRFVERHRRPGSRLIPIAGVADAPSIDVVVTCTSSRTPVWREPASIDRLIVAVGSYEPDVAEIGEDTVRASRVVVDEPDGAAHEAGDLIVAGIARDRVESLASVLSGDRRSSREPVLFKTVGCAAWDLAAARVARDLHDPLVERAAD